MSLGKASIKRASAASKKKTAETKAAETKVAEAGVVENAEVLTQVDTEEVQAKFVTEDVKEGQKHCPVRLIEEMPTFLL